MKSILDEKRFINRNCLIKMQQKVHVITQKGNIDQLIRAKPSVPRQHQQITQEFLMTFPVAQAPENY